MAMTANGNVGETMRAMREAYVGLLVSVPLVLVGILVTGSLYYLAVVRPQIEERSLRHWIAYLFPYDMYTSRSARIDVAIWLLNGAVFIPIFEICVVVFGLIIGVTSGDVLVSTFGTGPATMMTVWAAVAIQFLGFWLGQGIGQYSGHLAMHRIPLLWAVHRVHHSAESANLFAFLRSHPIEHFVNGATRVIGTAAGTGIALYATGNTLLAETAIVIFWYNIIYVLAGFRSVDHLHIPVSYGRFLDVVIGSPVMHQVHHSAEVQHRDVNMAGAGYIFDWMFGTLYVPKKGETWRWGLNEHELGDANPHNTLRGFFIEPLATMRAEIRKLMHPSPPRWNARRDAQDRSIKEV